MRYGWGQRVVVAVAAALTIIGMTTTTATARPAAGPPAGDTCTWGGTASAPTGSFTIDPGLTGTPSVQASRFFVTGDIACRSGYTGRLTYVGQIDAGGTCAANTFEGRADGIPGIRYFVGFGAGPLGPARLYSSSGDLKASENANVNTLNNAPHFADCETPTGFRGGDFSSTIVIVG